MSDGTHEFRAVVEDVRERGRQAGRMVWELALSMTAFTPGTRGVLVATSRSGATLEIEVMDVDRAVDGTIWHAVRKPLGAETEVLGRVWDSADRG